MAMKISDLPSNIATDVDHAQVRDLSKITGRKKRYIRLARLSLAAAFITFLLIEAPISLISLTAKMPLPFFFYGSIGAAVLATSLALTVRAYHIYGLPGGAAARARDERTVAGHGVSA